ncbi:zinc ribbon domain-containing protein [Clostridium estertheticum]|uniref:zinc ribbon domain-containing protein n=1 Tax=Clostridium estertheticum TaxID=238834 RepID=UPI0013E9431A|nr:zinc ribbon domain-containing protein [Clostridium estertheticum]MBZ9685924.1 zinc ribbon domain-containing protein [Clostridium estertheticum]
MKNSKKLFFVLITLLSLFILSIVILGIFGVASDYNYANGNISEIIPPLIILPLMFILFFGTIFLIGRFVFKDSKQRGMDPWLWTTIAIFVPNLIGLIIYLVVRTSYTKKICTSCGKPVDEHFMNCPFCGYKLKENCNSCGSAVDPEWNVCPKCAAKLK